MISKIGFIGAGKVGTSLGRYFIEKGINLSGYYSKTKSHAADSADFTNSHFFKNIEDITRESDAIFVTVPDGNIASVWSQLKELDLKDKFIIHMSGAMTSEIFAGIKEKGAHGFSLHPLFAICTRKESWRELESTYFTVEGKDESIEEIKLLMEKTGNPLTEITADSKISYHAASVFVSNLVIGTVYAGKQIFDECGFTGDFSENAWKALFMGNAENIVNNGLAGALTGPVERADSETVGKHLASLNGSTKDLYIELSRMILDIAKVKNSTRDYTKIEKELEQ